MFSEAKTTQAAARLLQQAGGSMNLMVLLKLLYLADRSSLAERGRAITNDTYYGMKLGPVLGITHDVATEPQIPDENHYWPHFISAPESYKVKLVKSPGNDDLSENEDRILDSIFTEFKRFTVGDPFALPRWMHLNLSEVKEVPNGQRVDLPVEDILRAIQKTDDEITHILGELEMLHHVDMLLGVPQ